MNFRQVRVHSVITLIRSIFFHGATYAIRRDNGIIWKRQEIVTLRDPVHGLRTL
jgi:hypothetical protein